MLRKLALCLWVGISVLAASVFAAEETPPVKELVVAESPRSFNLDPLHTFTAFESQFYTAIYEGLVVNDPYTLEPTPAVASRWNVSADGRTYRFFLRPEAVFSDGTPVRAQDFVAAWMRMLDPAAKAEYSFLFDPIKGARAFRNGQEKDPKKVGIRAVADKTLEVELDKPAPYFLKVLCHISFLPIHPSVLKTPNWGAGKTAIGNGPFVMTQRSDSEVVLEKNKRYWDAANVGMDRIRIRFMSDAAKATDDYLAGKIDWSTIFEVDKVQNSDKVEVFPMFATSYFYFVCDKAPWKDWRVRRGLALLLGWDQIRTTKNFIFPDDKLVPQIPGYPDVKGIDAQSTDEGMKLLSDAGFPGGKGLPTLTVKVGDSDTADMVKGMADTWKTAIGLAVDVKIFDADTYFDELRKADFTMGSSTWIGDYADPLTFLQLWTTDSNLNDAHFSDADYDAAVNDSLSIQDNAERYKKMAQAEGILLSKAALLPLAHSPAVHLIDLNHIGGWFPNPLDIHPFKFIVFKELKAPSGVALAR